MKKVALYILLLSSLTFATFYFLPNKETAITNYPSDGRDVIAFGDSLVYGEGSESGGGFVKILMEDVHMPIINLGVNGNTTVDGLNRISVLSKYRPKVVILLLGGNDYLLRKSQKEIFDNLGKIIEEIQKTGAVVLLVGLRGQLLGSRHDAYFEELVDKYNVAYVPNILGGIMTNPDLMSDTLHPNDKGYRIMADKIKPVLEGIL